MESSIQQTRFAEAQAALAKLIENRSGEKHPAMMADQMPDDLKAEQIETLAQLAGIWDSYVWELQRIKDARSPETRLNTWSDRSCFRLEEHCRAALLASLH